MDDRAQKFEDLRRMVEKFAGQPVCIAFSGGVDSSLLLKLACDGGKKTGMPVYAVTFDTMLHPACDLETARRVAAELGAVHEIISLDELAEDALRDNPTNRCYLCKRRLFRSLRTFAKAKQISCVMDGTNEDDLHVYRPGIKALKELAIVSPLAICHMTKAEVKELAALLGISVASRPSTPCMATRLPYGTRIEYGVLRRIEAGEAYLKTLFSGNVRLRLHGDVARIELDGDQMEKALAERKKVCEGLKELGFPYVTLDLEGFRSGSMDVYIMPQKHTS